MPERYIYQINRIYERTKSGMLFPRSLKDYTNRKIDCRRCGVAYGGYLYDEAALLMVEDLLGNIPNNLSNIVFVSSCHPTYAGHNGIPIKKRKLKKMTWLIADSDWGISHAEPLYNLFAISKRSDGEYSLNLELNDEEIERASRVTVGRAAAEMMHNIVDADAFAALECSQLEDAFNALTFDMMRDCPKHMKDVKFISPNISDSKCRGALMLDNIKDKHPDMMSKSTTIEDIARIWIGELDPLPERESIRTGRSTRTLSVEEIASFGKERGLDSKISALVKGVPLEDILA